MGRYHLAEPLGGGPTGEVFRAKVYGVAGFERQFAVKRFHPEFVKDPDTAAAIAAATRTYGSLEHPRIARLHEYGVTGGETFTATELIHGMDLGQLASIGQSRGRVIAPGAWAALISQAARTVGYAHGRGISHLGLCPTNLIATPDGEAKITDFCLLPARLPGRPGTDASLRARLPYLAPEQIAGETPSAATDVFQLGVIAYELLTGRTAYAGASSQDIAQKILAGLPPSPNLPGAIVSVLMRCLARSPFERYPDARALADALDAALRSAPLPGSTNDIGQAVRDALQRLTEIRDEQVSGAVSFPLPAPPASKPAGKQSESPAAQPPAPPAGSETRAPTTLRLDALRPGAANGEPPEAASPAERKPEAASSADRKTAAPARKSAPMLPPHVGQAIHNPEGGPPIKMPPIGGEVAPEDLVDEEMPTQVRERAKGFVSVPGAPRVRPGSAPLGPPARDAGSPAPLPGTPRSAAPTAATAGKPPSTPPPPPGRKSGNLPRPGSQPGMPASAAPSAPDSTSTPASAADPSPGVLPPSTPPASASDPPPSAAQPAISPVELPAPVVPATAVTEQAIQRTSSLHSAQSPSHAARSVEAPRRLTPAPARLETLTTEDPTGMPAGVAGSLSEQLGEEPEPAASAHARPPSRKRGLVLVLSLAAIALLGGAGFVVYSQVLAKQSTPLTAATSDAGASAQPVAADAGDSAAQAPADAAAAPPLDAADPADAAAQKAVVSDKLIIRSQPAGAKVYLDGSPQGKTPETLDGTSDRYRLALVLPGYKLHLGEIDGNGVVDVTLEEVTPPEGEGGIKVRCNKKNRYYVFLNGADTGQLCPSERLGVDPGSHVLEIYDPVTESRREFRIEVEDTHRSVRIRVD